MSLAALETAAVAARLADLEQRHQVVVIVILLKTF